MEFIYTCLLLCSLFIPTFLIPEAMVSTLTALLYCLEPLLIVIEAVGIVKFTMLISSFMVQCGDDDEDNAFVKEETGWFSMNKVNFTLSTVF